MDHTLPAGDCMRVDIRPQLRLVPSLVARGEPRQCGSQVVNVEALGDEEMIGQTVIEQVGCIPGWSLCVELPPRTAVS